MIDYILTILFFIWFFSPVIAFILLDEYIIEKRKFKKYKNEKDD